MRARMPSGSAMPPIVNLDSRSSGPRGRRPCRAASCRAAPGRGRATMPSPPPRASRPRSAATEAWDALRDVDPHLFPCTDSATSPPPPSRRRDRPRSRRPPSCPCRRSCASPCRDRAWARMAQRTSVASPRGARSNSTMLCAHWPHEVEVEFNLRRREASAICMRPWPTLRLPSQA